MPSLRELVRQITPGVALDLYRNARYGRLSQLRAGLNPAKLRLIDVAMENGGRTFADLGGMWGINGGYSLYCADQNAKQATLVDRFASPHFLEEQRTRANLSYLKANFALPETAKKVAGAECVMLFDVLLHQVKPDWNEVLKTYAPQTRMFLIYNQQYTGAETVRLLDKGEDWYLRHVPHSPGDSKVYADLFAKENEPHPAYPDRIYRDISDVWQWGITDADLKRVLRELGFQLMYEEDCGLWPKVEEIRNKAFLFRKE